MGLDDIRKIFFEKKTSASVFVKNHAFRDYPERGFSKIEIVRLVKHGNGRFTLNNSPEAIKGTYLFFPRDEEGRECKLVLSIEKGEGSECLIIVVFVYSAYREL